MKYETDGIQLGDKYYESTEALISGDGGSSGTPLKNIVIEEEEVIPGFYGKILVLDSPIQFADGTIINPIEDNKLPFSIKIGNVSYHNQSSWPFTFHGVTDFEYSNGQKVMFYFGCTERDPVADADVSAYLIKQCSGFDFENDRPIWGQSDCLIVFTGDYNFGTIELEYVNKPSV